MVAARDEDHCRELLKELFAEYADFKIIDVYLAGAVDYSDASEIEPPTSATTTKSNKELN